MNYLLSVPSQAVGRVPHCEFEGGVLVEEADLQAALAALGSEVAEQSATQWDGVVAVTLRARAAVAPADADVTVHQWHSYCSVDTKPFVEIARTILWPALRRPVVLWNARAQNRVPVPKDGKFHLFIGLGTRSGRLRKFLGHSGEMERIIPEGTDVIIRDPEGEPIIQVASNAAWVLANCCNSGENPSYNEIPIFRKLCEELAWDLTATSAQKAERAEREARERRVRSRAAYITECSKRFEKTLTGTRDAITRGHANVRSLQEQLVRRIRETQGAERKLVQLEASKPSAVDGYGVEFDKLTAVPKVRDVQIADGVIKVFTDTLYCVDPRTKKRHEIGAFRIEIFTSNGAIRWYNLTRKVKGYPRWGDSNAPHVNESGEACLGTMAEIIPELVGNYEFAALAMVCIQFVESVNTDDQAGKYIDQWPIAE